MNEKCELDKNQNRFLSLCKKNYEKIIQQILCFDVGSDDNKYEWVGEWESEGAVDMQNKINISHAHIKA